jgi:uncharacterized membrane protein
MTKLTLGVLLWSLTHFIPALFPGLRDSMARKLGENGFKGVFTLLMIAAIYLIISGWKASIPESVYLPPAWGRHLTALLMLIAMLLFVAPYHATNIKRVLRHPQLTGVVIWGAGHLLANGEARSIVLFGGLTAWAILEILLINRREGAWVKPDSVPIKRDLILAAAGITLYLVLAFSHRWLFGVSPFVA